MDMTNDYGDPDYDEFDVLLDTDPIALRDRCRKAEGLLIEIRGLMSEAVNDDASWPVVSVSDLARIVGSVPGQDERP